MYRSEAKMAKPARSLSSSVMGGGREPKEQGVLTIYAHAQVNSSPTSKRKKIESKAKVMSEADFQSRRESKSGNF